MATAGLWFMLVTVFAVEYLLFDKVDGFSIPSSVKLTNNGYTGVVIAIHHDEPENKNLITAIKDMLSDASSYLYNATNGRVFFEEVTILIPDTWKSITYEPSGFGSYDRADVVVTQGIPDLTLPYTKHYQGCGRQGAYIHLTSQFLTDAVYETLYGNRGMIFAYEWGQYRWGLFSEYADVGDTKPFYFSINKEKWIPTSCSYDQEGETLLYDGKKYIKCDGNPSIGYKEGCVHFPSNIDMITKFNDSKIHSSEAPNKQNRLCNGKSYWEVMKSHPDFKDNTKGIADGNYVMPKFVITQNQSVRIVLVLDTSERMNKNKRIHNVAAMARHFIKYVAVDGSYIGIVGFDYNEKTISELTLINSEQSRDNLADLVPTTAAGQTCIKCGLQRALMMLRKNESVGRILLVTNGNDNTNRTASINKITTSRDIIIDVVTYDKPTEDYVIKLQESSGGNMYFQTDDPASTGLHDALLAAMDEGIREHDRRVELFAGSASYQDGEIKTFKVFIDSSVGRKTTFQFTWTADKEAISVIVISPKKRSYNSCFLGYQTDLISRVITVRFSETEVGDWSFKVTSYAVQNVFISVSTYASQDGVDPIIATSYLSGSITDFAKKNPLIIYADVRQGLNPVIGANVTATIERLDLIGNSSHPVEVVLKDNGGGADVTKDDGIYTRTFTEFSGAGYYGININVNNDDQTAKILQGESVLPYSRVSIDPTILSNEELKKISNKIFLPGMKVPSYKSEPASRFNRRISGGYTYVLGTPSNWQHGADVFPPNTILDLEVTSTIYDNGRVTLEFTAPGDDYDHGSAKRYVINMSNNLTDLQGKYWTSINQSDIVAGDLSKPGQFGDRERFVIKVDVPLKQYVVSYKFTVHAFDDSGNEAKISNLALGTLIKDCPYDIPLIICVGGSVLGSLVLAGMCMVFRKVYSRSNTTPVIVISIPLEAQTQHPPDVNRQAFVNTAFNNV